MHIPKLCIRGERYQLWCVNPEPLKFITSGYVTIDEFVIFRNEKELIDVKID